MLHHCSSCNRPFGTQQALDQHLQFSSKHMKYPSKPSKPSDIQTSGSLEAIKLYGYASSGTYQPSRPRQPNVIASSSGTSQGTKYDSKEVHAQEKKTRWSVISPSQVPMLFDTLLLQCHPPTELLDNQFLIQPLNAGDLAGLRRCKTCNILQKNARGTSECKFHPGVRKRVTTDGGKIRHQFSCCGTATRGCTPSSTHSYAILDSEVAAKYQSFEFTPPPSHQRQTFRAVVLDCEMAGVGGGTSEVILICAADYFTGAILLDKFVRPTRKITEWRSKIHGITPSAMQVATLRGEVLSGWEQAREELWKLIDADTIIVGHALHHDLDALRMIHTRIVDSEILTANAVGADSHRQWGLKTLCDELLHMEIRENKKGVHDCLEDVLATREVVLWCALNQQELKDWANIKRLEEERKKEMKKKKDKEGKGKGKKKEMEGNKKAQMTQKANKQKFVARGVLGAPKFVVGGFLGGGLSVVKDEYGDSNSESEMLDSNSDCEVMHWSDVAEDFGWPHPNTGYDPWSD